MDCNRILNLYFTRKSEEIMNAKRAMVQREYDKQPIVKEYLKIEKELRESLDNLKKAYPDTFVREDKRYTANIGIHHITINNDTSFIADNVYEEIDKKYDKILENDMRDLRALREEIEAVLVISDDANYKIDVLKSYGILKKDGKLSDE